MSDSRDPRPWSSLQGHPARPRMRPARLATQRLARRERSFRPTRPRCARRARPPRRARAREKKTRALAKRAFPRRDRLGFGTRSRSKLSANATHPTRRIRDGSLDGRRRRFSFVSVLRRRGRSRFFVFVFAAVRPREWRLGARLQLCGDVRVPGARAHKPAGAQGGTRRGDPSGNTVHATRRGRRRLCE